MDNKRFNLASHWEELEASFQKICLKEIDLKDLMVITKGCNPTRQFRLLEARAQRIRENQATILAIEEQLTQTGPTQIPSGSQVEHQISSPVASHHLDTNKSMAERVIPHDPEVVGFGERSAQEPEVVENHSRISSPSNRNITPTQTEHNIVTSESNSNSDALWLQMSHYAEKSAKQFAELEASHQRMKKLTTSMDKIVKNLQEGHAKWRKDSEETNKRLNLFLEEQHRSCQTQTVWHITKTPSTKVEESKTRIPAGRTMIESL
ncbi:hypothetical protein O181_081696 [Austropuccinia psidii MF-1]|uniref:Uncharacterized protein n=1 Tax=Austropuccinia psidii MF-1 TaxID=1389203 RepID=A0A9Q3FKP8_9BASI|nr:hypothetical protein [Austropuccinia psidii MF-1]